MRRVLQHIGANDHFIRFVRKRGGFNRMRKYLPIMRLCHLRPFRIGLDRIQHDPRIGKRLRQHSLGRTNV